MLQESSVQKTDKQDACQPKEPIDTPEMQSWSR